MKRLLSTSSDASFARGAAAPESLSQISVPSSSLSAEALRDGPLAVGDVRTRYAPELALQSPYPLMLRVPELCKRLALSPTHVYRLSNQGRMPALVKLSWHAVGLCEHDVDLFIASRMLARRHGSPAPLGCRSPLPFWPSAHVPLAPQRALRLLRRREVQRLVGMSQGPLYRLIQAGRFPPQISLGEMAVRWVAYEVVQWVHAPGPWTCPFCADSPAGRSGLFTCAPAHAHGWAFS